MTRTDGLRPAQLELLALLASNVTGEISEPELERVVEGDVPDILALPVFPRSFLESMAGTGFVRTAYRGIVGSGYIAWSITDAGRARLTELERLPGAIARGAR